MSFPTWVPQLCVETDGVRKIVRLTGFADWFIDTMHAPPHHFIGETGWTTDKASAFNFAGQGPQGPAGPQGAQGAQGAQGQAGANGTNGTNGAPGTVTQQLRATTDATGLYVWTYPNAYAGGVVPVVEAIAEGPNPQAGVQVNVQLEGAPTNTSARFRVTKSNQSVVALLGLTILSIPASVGATVIHVTARAP